MNYNNILTFLNRIRRQWAPLFCQQYRTSTLVVFRFLPFSRAHHQLQWWHHLASPWGDPLSQPLPICSYQINHRLLFSRRWMPRVIKSFMFPQCLYDFATPTNFDLRFIKFVLTSRPHFNLGRQSLNHLHRFNSSLSFILFPQGILCQSSHLAWKSTVLRRSDFQGDWSCQ